MLTSLRRSASASAAIFTNSLPRWLISITDMPASCQLTISRLACSSTSTGIVAGPAPKLKIRAAGLMPGAAAIGLSVAVAVVRPVFGDVVGGGIRDVGAGSLGVGRSVAVAIAVAVPIAVLAVFVAIEDA